MNVGLYKGYGMNEQKACERIAQLVRPRPGLSVAVVPGRSESADRWRLEGLYAQLQEARRVADRVGGPAIIVSIHTDSGTRSHTFGCYGSQACYDLAWTMESFLAPAMGTKHEMLALTGYAFDTERGVHLSCLMEGGSHQNPENVDLIVNHPGVIADAIAEGAAAWFGIEAQQPTPAIEQPDLAGYFAVHGHAPVWDFAIPKRWRALYDAGVNIGPAVTPELDGAAFGEPPGSRIQFFESAAIVARADLDWQTFLWQTFLHRPPVAT
jgi:hypothetical protein